MTKSRLSVIRYYIKNDDYFGVVAKTLDLIEREMRNPARKKRGEKLLAALKDDMRHLQEKYRVVKLPLPKDR